MVGGVARGRRLVEQVMSEQHGRDYPVVMDVPMVAEMLLTDVHQVRKWASAGIIPAHRIPGTRKYRFLRDEVLEWLSSLPGSGADDGRADGDGHDTAEHRDEQAGAGLEAEPGLPRRSP